MADHGSSQGAVTTVARQSALRVMRDLFGEDSNEEQLQWAVFLREVLRRDPVHSDFGNHMPWGQADEQVARVFVERFGSLPDEEDWEHADSIFAFTSRLLCADDLEQDALLPYVPARRRCIPACGS